MPTSALVFTEREIDLFEGADVPDDQSPNVHRVRSG